MEGSVDAAGGTGAGELQQQSKGGALGIRAQMPGGGAGEGRTTAEWEAVEEGEAATVAAAGLALDCAGCFAGMDIEALRLLCE